MDEADSWVSNLEYSINEKNHYYNYLAINKGIGGENTRQALERIQDDVQNLCPEILSIQFGANDSDCWVSNRGLPCVSAGSFYENLMEIIFRSKKFEVRKIFLHTNHKFLKTRLESNGLTHNDTLFSYNEIIRKVALDSDSELIDIGKALLNLNPESYCMPLPDGVHLSKDGSKEYFKVIYPHLKTYIDSIVS